MKQKLSIDFGMQLKGFEKLNKNFTKAKCYVLALGKNRNGSNISKDAADDAYGSLFFVPVVGHLIDNGDGKYRLGGHDYKLNLDTLEFESLCVPFGVAVPSDSPTYEEVVESDGTTNTYLTSDVVLWTGRYPELADAIYSDEIMFGQSMEIFVDASEKLADDNKYTDITAFTFDALCMLNKSDDAELNIEPCFPSASIVKEQEFSIDKDKFDSFLAEMRDELKRYFEEIAGGISLATGENTNIEDTKKETVMDFAASYNKKREAIASLLKGMGSVEKDENGCEVSYTSYYLMDFDDTYAFVSKESWVDGVGYSDSYWRIGYKYNDVDLTAEFVGEAEAVTKEWLTAEERAALNQTVVSQFRESIEQITSEYNDVVSERDTLNENYSTLVSEADELREFKAAVEKEKRDSALNEIYARFDTMIGGIEEYMHLKDAIDNYTVEEFEHECYAIKGKFDSENIAEPKQPTVNFGATLPIDGTNPFDDVESVKAPYGGIIEYYRKKAK